MPTPTLEDQIADLIRWVRESGHRAADISAATQGAVSRTWVILARDDSATLNPKAETIVALAKARRVLGERVPPTAAVAA